MHNAHHTCFNFRQIEDIIDNRQQVFACLLDRANKLTGIGINFTTFLAGW
jgi:hypothetical protein